jgi:hypothetical protein
MLNMKSALALIVAGTVLTACKHAEVSREPTTESGAVMPTNPRGFYAGHPPTSAQDGEMFFAPRTQTQVAADEEITRHIVGTWVADSDTDSHEYQTITFRPDGSFTASTCPKKLVSGLWRVDRRVLFLRKENAAPSEFYGFHAIDLVDDHQLVCGIDISVAGRMRFRR